ncbi:uncharacterized protein RJT21DRAFT_114779 [Scheffersomyces amazonensis]|uniref:uncharacterized protein n=1 Tax=Scheffersomyces amazonensis TaxID=1078765 RepID=UPI00315D21D1
MKNWTFLESRLMLLVIWNIGWKLLVYSFQVLKIYIYIHINSYEILNPCSTLTPTDKSLFLVRLLFLLIRNGGLGRTYILFDYHTYWYWHTLIYRDRGPRYIALSNGYHMSYGGVYDKDISFVFIRMY